MSEQIKTCHTLLNNIYSDCEALYEKIKKQYDNVKLNSYKGHYIKINNKYEYQKYYMPVISVGEMGDICFNLDGISLEYFVDKNKLLENCHFDLLLKGKYDVEIYDGRDSMIDIYDKGMKQDILIDKLRKWQTNLIGITINCQDKSIDDIISMFEKICKILGV